MAEYKINYTQSNFTGGLIAAELYGRNDFNKVKSGMKKCTNWTVREAGGLEFRRGTKYLADLPGEAGSSYKASSLDKTFLVFCKTGIYYLTSANSWAFISYPEGVVPDIEQLQFNELKQRLYYFDGNIKLCAVYVNENGALYTQVETFEVEPVGATIYAQLNRKNEYKPEPYVEVVHEYAFSLAKDIQSESIISTITPENKLNYVSANVELTRAGSEKDSDDHAVGDEVDVFVTLSDTVASEYNGGKIYVYKKYQGYFYFLTALDILEDQTEYKFEDVGAISVDMSKSAKNEPPYLDEDGSISGVNSIADYGQRVFLTMSEASNNAGTNIIFSQIGNTNSLAYSNLRESDEAGYLEVPISHYDQWCKVVSGLDLMFSTSYTISKISGYGDLTLDTILWDGLSKNVAPVRTRRSLIYTNTSNRNIYDLAYNEYGQYDSVDLTLLVKYVFENKTIKKLAFKDYPVKTIYVLCDDGELYCLTYIKEQNIYAWYKIEHFGIIEDLQVINREDEDDIYIVSNDNGHRVVELAYPRTKDVYMDCSLEVPLVGVERIEDTPMYGWVARGNDYMYAWADANDNTMYTKTDIPVVGTIIYDAEGYDTGKKVTFYSTGDNAIEKWKGWSSVDGLHLYTDSDMEFGTETIAEGMKDVIVKERNNFAGFKYSNKTFMRSSADDIVHGGENLYAYTYGTSIFYTKSVNINNTDTITLYYFYGDISTIGTITIADTFGGNVVLSYDDVDYTIDSEADKVRYVRAIDKDITSEDFHVVYTDERNPQVEGYLYDRDGNNIGQIDELSNIGIIVAGKEHVYDDDFNYILARTIHEDTNVEGTTIKGLDMFEGKRVRVFDTGNNRYYGDYDVMHPKYVVEGGRVVDIDDLDFNGYLVENGKITLPSSVVFEGTLLVGMPYYAVMETIPLEFSDSSGNSTIGRKKIINDAYLRYGDSRGVSYKTVGHEYDCGICERDISSTAKFLERGQVRLNTNGEYKWNSTIKILQRQPYPARIESITLGLTFNDKS